MEFDIAIKNLNQLLKAKQPKEFNSSWIKANALSVYEYICENIRTENNDIDWDKVTGCLERSFQRRWIEPRQKQTELYENWAEVNAILAIHNNKLYTFLAPLDENDKRIRHFMIIRLVRIGQKGNVIAQEELVKWVTYIINDWLDNYPQISRWKGYTDEFEDVIKGCMRRYRYTGSFLNYLFRTLEYSARSKAPTCSLDDPILNGKRKRVDYVL